MGFRVTARTLLHLGSSMVNSDAIAISELLKNAFASGSRTVNIEIVSRIPHKHLQRFFKQMSDATCDVESVKREVISLGDDSAPTWKTLERSIRAAQSTEDLATLLRDSNYIAVSDEGCGMSSDELEDAFLTIGGYSDKFPRKGIGRLASMRLGSFLQVTSGTAEDRIWNCLEIDWASIRDDSDALLEDVEVDIFQACSKQLGTSGTTILISNLAREWTKEMLADLATRHLSVLTDPLGEQTFNINVSFNGETIDISQAAKTAFHPDTASIRAELTQDSGGIRLAGEIKTEQHTHALEFTGAHLIGLAGVSAKSLDSLGPFSLMAYLGETPGLETSNGPMLFQDNFRILPYGENLSNWNLKENPSFRAEVFGTVKTSSSANPAIREMASREGLVDCEEKKALINIVSYLLSQEFLYHAQPTRDKIDLKHEFKSLATEAEMQEKQIDSALALLQSNPNSAGEVAKSLIGPLDHFLRAVVGMAKITEQENYERIHLLRLGALGLMPDILSHDLNRSYYHLKEKWSAVKREHLLHGDVVSDIDKDFQGISNLIKVLGNLGIYENRRPEYIDILDLTRQVIQAFEWSLNQHGISCTASIGEGRSKRNAKIKTSRGMVVEVIGQLLDNSIYWLSRQVASDESFKPEVSITFDPGSKTLLFCDNGPGVPDKYSERIFDPFFSMTPGDRNKGLGLFLSRAVARQHDANLYLLPDNDREFSSTFILKFDPTQSDF